MSLSPITKCNSPLVKYQNENRSKFTRIPIGLTQAQFNLDAFKIPEEFKWFQMRSVCLMAFCHLYIQDPLKWSSQTINTILINGAKVVKDNYVRVKEIGPLDCVLNIENCIAKIRIEEPIFLNTVESSSASLIDTMQLFFNNHQHGLFRCLNFCYLIWKMNGIYFIFDAQGNGNSPEDKNGFASLLCTESLKDLCKLLKTISSIKSDDCYSISTIKMKHFRKGVNGYTKPRIQYAGTNTYTILSECFAILAGKFHVGHKGFQLLKKRQSMAVALMVLIFNEIQPPNSWNSQLIDKIILLGTKLFHECKKTPEGEVTIQHLPRSYCVLKYKFKIDYKPYDQSGHMGSTLDEMRKNVLMYLQRAINGATKKTVIIQTNSLVFAVWACNEYYYIFDAYARNENGEIADDRLGTPCIHMHGNLESLCSILCTNLNTIATNDGFAVHAINVTLECNEGQGKVSDDDLELINTFMDDLFWAEMNNFQESSARSSEEVYNLDDTSDDDIFMETVVGLNRTVTSIGSSESRSTASFTTESGSSGSRTESSSQDDLSNGTPNNDSGSQIGESMENVLIKKESKVRSKSPKKRKIKAEDDEEIIEDRLAHIDVKVEDADKQSKKKNKKQKDSKNKGKQIKQAEPDEKDENEEDADKQSVKKTKGSSGVSKKKGKKSKIAENDENDGTKTQVDGTKQSLVVVESSSGTETSIMKLLTTSFKISNRLLLVTEWGDFFVAHQDNDGYFLFDGCLCDTNSLIQIQLTELDSKNKLEDIDDVVKKIMVSKDKIKLNPKKPDKTNQPNQQPNIVAEKSGNGDVKTAFSGDVDASFWELIESMIELMKTTAKFDKIKNDLI